MRLYLCAAVVFLTVICHGAVILDRQGSLGADSDRLEAGQRVVKFPLRVSEGDFISVLCDAQGFEPYLMVTLEDGRRFERATSELTFLSTQSAGVLVSVATAGPDQQGSYQTVGMEHR